MVLCLQEQVSASGQDMVLRTFALMQLALPGMVLAINGVAAQPQLFGSKPENTLVNVVKSKQGTGSVDAPCIAHQKIGAEY